MIFEDDDDDDKDTLRSLMLLERKLFRLRMEDSILFEIPEEENEDGTPDPEQAPQSSFVDESFVSETECS